MEILLSVLFSVDRGNDQCGAGGSVLNKRNLHMYGHLKLELKVKETFFFQSLFITRTSVPIRSFSVLLTTQNVRFSCTFTLGDNQNRTNREVNLPNETALNT